jgi:serine/threonine protein kinase
MELVTGNELFTIVDHRKALDEWECVWVFRQVVSALLYCHRLLVCHRDLKPENIMIDDNFNVKIIDFGMAALQPEGRLLSTPCGSPHYAAPEVVSNKPYDGTQADVWSCGVILYVMLTGTTPFNYHADGSIKSLFRDIAKANYFMPAELSFEAQDLIRRIFKPDPKKRITMDEIWDHPLLHKYDELFGFDGPEGSKEIAVGPIPRIEEWKVKSIKDIDREILSNMRTLWHSESEHALLHKLLNDEYNQEKLFYAALIKHREEHLENFVGEGDGMGYSTSDYHHSRPPRLDDQPARPGSQPARPGSQPARSQSQYSIMNDEHLRRSHSFAGSPPSVSSYDPYRASKNPIVNANGEYVNITIHRHQSTSTNRTSTARGSLQPNLRRLEQLRHSQRASMSSAASLPRSGRSRSSMSRSSISRSSMQNWPSSPPILAMRPSDVHKRGVSFSHLRRGSAISTAVSTSSRNKNALLTPQPSLRVKSPDAETDCHAETLRDVSPIAMADQVVISRKMKANVLMTPRIKRANDDVSAHMMQSEIRKLSVDLEKACEEAFFRSSVGSDLTARASAHEEVTIFDTPDTSIVSQRTPGLSLIEDTLPQRPSPVTETPNTYLAKTIEETRRKLAIYKANPDESTAKFEEVMKMLENILPPSVPNPDRRTTSAPEARLLEHAIPLPVISEEIDLRLNKSVPNWQRSVTSPLPIKRKASLTTVRMVPPSSPDSIAPLSIRKRGEKSEQSESPTTPLDRNTAAVRTKQSQESRNAHGLESIAEDSILDTPTVIRRKRSGWFGLRKDSGFDEHSEIAGAALPSANAVGEQVEQDRFAVDASTTENSGLQTGPSFAQSDEFPMRKKRPNVAKRGWAKWIGRIGRDKGEDLTMTQEGGEWPRITIIAAEESTDMTQTDTTVQNTQSLASFFSTSSSIDAPQNSGPGRSWFARFFRIKPVVDVLCFNISRARVRQEMVILLKEWQRHGVRDLQYSRETNTITARVDRNNALDIKPVTLRIELFVVLEHGNKVGLSIARFTQLKGAASGFRRVLEVVDRVMRGRGWLIQDEEKWRALSDIVRG